MHHDWITLFIIREIKLHNLSSAIDLKPPRWKSSFIIEWSFLLHH